MFGRRKVEPVRADTIDTQGRQVAQAPQQTQAMPQQIPPPPLVNPDVQWLNEHYIVVEPCKADDAMLGNLLFGIYMEQRRTNRLLEQLIENTK